jgi:hypothetical protein
MEQSSWIFWAKAVFKGKRAPLPILECPGIFEVVLPDRWTAWGSDDREYDITPDDGPDVAINITVLPKAPRGADSTVAARQFAKKLGIVAADQLVVPTRRQWGQQRSFLKVAVDGRRWFIACLFFRHGFVLATVNTATDSEDVFAEAERILMSIVPA